MAEVSTIGPFEYELTSLINKYSRENDSDTPDFILARYMLDCLDAWNRSVKLRNMSHPNLTSGVKPPEIQLRLLSDYEFGRLVTFIEWVGRGAKPIAECSSRLLRENELQLLRNDLRMVLDLVNEPGVFGYIAKNGKWFTFGVTRYYWALEVVLGKRGHQAACLQGAVFGYSPDAIDRFTASSESTPKSRRGGTCSKVEIVRSSNEISGGGTAPLLAGK